MARDPALRAYFFVPRMPVRAWLDVMVWSSAQPLSIYVMILHTFEKDRAGGGPHRCEGAGHALACRIPLPCVLTPYPIHFVLRTTKSAYPTLSLCFTP
jgi:hypothetical protein